MPSSSETTAGIPLRLIVDTNILVSELTRERGRTLLADPALQLLIAAFAWEEVVHELPKRFDILVGRGQLSRAAADAVLAKGMATAAQYVERVPPFVYQPYEEEARVRIAARDPDDWPTVALAPATEAAIWTRDADFFGCGVATWHTETLLAVLAFRAQNVQQ